MDYQESQENNCRICLQKDVTVNWNDYLQDHDDLLTYRDCYYKYTQLDYFDGDNLYLSTMLCSNCSNSLENINAFITKAVETHNYLQERLSLNIKYENSNKKDIKNFETVLISETDNVIKPEIQSVSLYEDNGKERFDEKSDCESITEHKFSIKHVQMYEGTTKDCFNDDTSESESIPDSIKQPKRKRKKISIKRKYETKTSSEELQSNKVTSKKFNKSWVNPTCCSICSKVLTSKYKAIQHEQTHIKNRERNEICTECGMKFYNKTSLRSHMQIHMENREKTHKCEFCDKAFYNTGALNVHRRIHLGQMVKCTLCTKEYYRQVDLDKHMVSHSATKISDDLKPKTKYFVHCDICDVTIRSTQYKSHSAKHMNEPLAKCSICDKEFFSRDSCISHLKKLHKKGTGERSNFVISYKTTRYTNLFLQQNIGDLYTKQ